MDSRVGGALLELNLFLLDELQKVFIEVAGVDVAS